MNRCDAWHDGHDCDLPGACSTALAAMLERVERRRQQADHERLEQAAAAIAEVAA